MFAEEESFFSSVKSRRGACLLVTTWSGEGLPWKNSEVLFLCLFGRRPSSAAAAIKNEENRGRRQKNLIVFSSGALS